jgi:hypothetical protein
MPRWGQRSADAETWPETLRQSAIDPAFVFAGITVAQGKSLENATGAHEPVVSECMCKLSTKQDQKQEIRHQKTRAAGATPV